MPDKRRKCGNHCLRCWRNQLKHANKNTGNKDLEIIKKDQFNSIEDFYSIFINDCFDIRSMEDNLPKIDNHKDIESSVYVHYKYWISQNNNIGKQVSKNKLIYELKYRLYKLSFNSLDNSSKWIIKPMNNLQYNGSKIIESHEKCSICFNNSNTITNCGHHFCKKCLTQWNNKSSEFNCPYCRNKDIKLYKTYIISI